MEENPQEEFVLALDKIDLEYSRMLLSKLTRETRKPNPNIQSLTDYVNDAMVYLRTSNSKYKPHLQTFTAELEAANTDTSLDTNLNDNWGNNSRGRGNGRGRRRGGNNGTHQPIPNYVCGKKHWYINCFYLNKDAKNRPSNFQGDEAIRKRIAEARKKDSDLNKRISNSLKHVNDPQSNNSSIDINDNTMPTDGRSFIVTSVSYNNTTDYMVEPTIPMSPTTYSIVETNSPTLINHVVEHYSPTSTHNTNAVEPETPALLDSSDLPLQLTTMTANHANNNSGISLINQVILDPGSNTHVINSDKWVGWEPKEDGNGMYITAGSTHVPVKAWGDFHIAVKTPTGQRLVRITKVAYAPGFLTSLLGLA
ncbi:hypothetical protein DPSP01_014669 [Paraphaeosphaeria sporulosa]